MSTSPSTIHAQERTLEGAKRGGEEWTQAEMARVAAHQGRDEELALELGRTLYAIYALRHALANGRAQREGRSVTRSSSRVLPYDLGFTTYPDEW